MNYKDSLMFQGNFCNVIRKKDHNAEYLGLYHFRAAVLL